MDYKAVDCVVYNLAKVEFFMFVHALLQHGMLDSFQNILWKCDRTVWVISLYWLISNSNYWSLAVTFVKSVVNIFDVHMEG